MKFLLGSLCLLSEIPFDIDYRIPCIFVFQLEDSNRDENEYIEISVSHGLSYSTSKKLNGSLLKTLRSAKRMIDKDGVLVHCSIILTSCSHKKH